jgi:hypothetical protein
VRRFDKRILQIHAIERRPCHRPEYFRWCAENRQESAECAHCHGGTLDHGKYAQASEQPGQFGKPGWHSGHRQEKKDRFRALDQPSGIEK